MLAEEIILVRLSNKVTSDDEVTNLEIGVWFEIVKTVLVEGGHVNTAGYED